MRSVQKISCFWNQLQKTLSRNWHIKKKWIELKEINKILLLKSLNNVSSMYNIVTLLQSQEKRIHNRISKYDSYTSNSRWSDKKDIFCDINFYFVAKWNHINRFFLQKIQILVTELHKFSLHDFHGRVCKCNHPHNYTIGISLYHR